jgi:hypothetical protein
MSRCGRLTRYWRWSNYPRYWEVSENNSHFSRRKRSGSKLCTVTKHKIVVWYWLFKGAMLYATLLLGCGLYQQSFTFLPFSPTFSSSFQLLVASWQCGTWFCDLSTHLYFQSTVQWACKTAIQDDPPHDQTRGAHFDWDLSSERTMWLSQ